MGGKIDLTGQRFGRLVVLNECGTDKYGNYIWKCKCDCGNITTAASGNLRRGHTQSCGCLWEDTVPGANKFDCVFDSNSRLYKIWVHIKRDAEIQTIEIMNIMAKEAYMFAKNG